MTLMHFNPMREMMSLREAMDRILEQSVPEYGMVRHGSSQEIPFRLPVDVYKTPEEIVIVASLPGLLPEEVDISIEGDTLTIRGELRPPLDNVEYLFQERPYGYFARSLMLNLPVAIEQAEAVFENGVLTLTLPKSKETRARSIKITKK
ncbi:MAG: Hsp20/alpha crystallin family protein [Anaerolineae bacterium]|nr:Hsp20/alpha crystallin family protein [Anaerolineae bacterium]